ncbi:hypothetical protein BH20ACT14_BH20ACT14_05010 [soil metagenome]
MHRNTQTRQSCDDVADVRCEIRLREQNHRARTALPGQGEVALEEPRARLFAERGDDEHDIDVRCNDLLAGVVRTGLVGCAARELRATGENRSDRRRRFFRGLERDPVADNGQLRSSLDLASRPAGEPRAGFPLLGEDVIGTTVLNCDPARVEPGGAMRRECVGPAIVPAERREVEHAPIVTDRCRHRVHSGLGSHFAAIFTRVAGSSTSRERGDT